jgi:hypothetical protein
MSIHEWGADYTVIFVKVDEVKVDLLFNPTNIDGHSSPVAYFLLTADTSKLEDHLVLQRNLLCFSSKSKFWCD